MAPWVKVGQPVDAAGRRLPGQDVHRHGVAHQPGGQHARRARSRSRRWCPTPTALLKPGTFARVHLETALVEQVADDSVRRDAVPLRRLPRVRRRRRPAGGPRAEDRRPRRRPHGDPRAASKLGDDRSRSPTSTISTDGMKVARRTADGVAMLSELCVRRPVFATMLVHVAGGARHLLVPRSRRRSLPARPIPPRST